MWRYSGRRADRGHPATFWWRVNQMTTALPCWKPRKEKRYAYWRCKWQITSQQIPGEETAHSLSAEAAEPQQRAVMTRGRTTTAGSHQALGLPRVLSERCYAGKTHLLDHAAAKAINVGDFKKGLPTAREQWTDSAPERRKTSISLFFQM